MLERELATQARHAATPRAAGIDAARFVMAFLVVTVHSLPVAGPAGLTIVGMVCRCAVPFFLITAGYFLKIPPRLTASLMGRPLVRLVPIYVFWMIVYYAIAAATKIAPLRFGVRDLLSGGTAFHLWYLPALGAALVVVPAGILLAGSRATGIACAALAIVAVLLGGYHDVLGLPGTAQRGGLLIAPVFVFIGYALARRTTVASPLAGASLAALGFAALFVEEAVIARRLGVPLADHDFTFGTIAYGIGVFLVARAFASGAALGRLATLGRYALGIYVSHLLFVWGLSTLFGKITPAALFWRAPLAFACALLLTFGLRQVPYFRRVVA